MVRFLQKLAAVTLMSTAAAEAWALPFTADSEYLIGTLKTEQGLPEDSATAILQTPDGYLWFGTFAGLVRFNSVDFTVFDPSNSPGMPGVGIVNLHLDKRGRMWVSTLSGLAVMEAGKWRTFDKKDGWEGDYVRSFAERENGEMLVCSYDGHAAVFKGDKFTSLSPPIEHGKGCFGYADEVGRWWIVQSGFTGWWDGKQWTVAPAFASEPLERGCGPARDGGLWVLSGNELVKLRHGAEVLRRPIPDDVGDFWSLSEDSRGNVWICSGNFGLFQVTPAGHTKHWTTANGLSASSTRFVFEDREGSLWVGTNNGGLQQFTLRRFRDFTTETTGESAVVSSVCAGASGTVWAATYGQGLYKLEGTALTPVSLPSESGNPRYLQSVMEDRSGRVWIGSYGEGLTILESGKARVIPPGETGGDNVIALFEDSRGEVWISGGQSVATFRNGKFHPVSESDGLPQETVFFFAEDDAGAIWAAQKSGVFRRADGKFSAVAGPDGNPVPHVSCLCRDAGGAMWMTSTTGALMRWRNGRMRAVQIPPEFRVRSAQGIINDGLGWFWIATNRGMLRAGVRELNQAIENPAMPGQWNLVDRFDGLPGSGFSASRQPVSTLSKDGLLCFATPRGVTTTSPASFQLNRTPPKVEVESMACFAPGSGSSPDTEVRFAAPFSNQLKFPAGSRRFEFRCAALTFKSANNVRCQMMLEGLHTAWQDMTQRTAVFYELPPGDYVFRFRAANADGIWSESEAKLPFTLLARFSQSLWFRAGSALLLVIAGAALAGWIARLRHLHVLENSEIHRQRDEIAHLSRVAALNELSGSLAHELNQPLAIILSNTQAAQRLLQRDPPAIGELREILDDIVAEDRRAGDVIQRLRAMLKRGESTLIPESATSIVEDVLTLMRSNLINRGVTVETSFAPGLPSVMADRIQIQQVLLNLITNACDSMASNEPWARRLRISTSELNGHVRVRVSDEGCGLPPGDPERIFKAFFTTKDYGLGMGLAICRSIVRAHHGHLNAEPNAPRGTSFDLTLPAAQIV